MCPNQADVYWDLPKLKSITPVGVELCLKIEEAFKNPNIEKRFFMCVDCYRRCGEPIGSEFKKEQSRRSQDPS